MLVASDGFIIHHVPITAWGLLSSVLKKVVCLYYFFLKQHHCGAAEQLFAVAVSAFTPKLWD